MTMRTCARVVPFGIADSAAGTVMFMEGLNALLFLKITADAQPLEGVLRLMVERTARTLRHLGLLEFEQDFLDVCGV